MNSHKKHFNNAFYIIGSVVVICFVPHILDIIIIEPFLSFFNIHQSLETKIITGISTIILLITYYFFFKLIEQRQISELVVRASYFLIDSFIGFLIGFIIISQILLSLYLFNEFTFLIVQTQVFFFEALILFAISSVWEEIIFRGIIFRITEKWLGTAWAILLSTFIFAIFYFIIDKHSSFLGVLLTVELSLITSISFIFTKHLWAPIFINIAWNFTILFYGTSVSGSNNFDHYLKSSLTKYQWVIHNEFSFINLMIMIFLSIIVFILFYKKTVKNKK